MTKDFATLEKYPKLDVSVPDKTKLFYHINKLTGVHYLYIPPFVAPDILTIAYGKGYLGFAHCYKIISRSYFMKELTKLFRSFIRYYPQYLIL